MIVEPDLRIPDFIKAGADIVSVHAEVAATIHLHRTLNQVKRIFTFGINFLCVFLFTLWKRISEVISDLF